MSETRPHLEGIATSLSADGYSQTHLRLVGNKTSFRRDCDSNNKTAFPLWEASSETRPHLEGIATVPADTGTESGTWVGNKTSFRRDCDYVFPIKRLDFNVSETRPHLEGIAT